MPEPEDSVNIFEYADFRAFLSDYYRARKSHDPKFSHRFIVARLKAGSAGWFADIIKGRTNLSGGHMVGLVKLLGLGSAQSDYFDSLVRFDQAGSMEEKNLHYRKILKLKGVKSELVGKDRFEYYSDWYHAVIRELLFFHDFKGDFAALGKKLHPSIAAIEAKKSIRLLEKLGFIHKEASGSYKPTSVSLKKDPSFKALHLSNFLKALAALGVESLERFPKENRDVSVMTLSLSEDGFMKAKEEIRSLRDRLLVLTQADENPNKVYQCNFHMFPVTRE